MNKFTILTLTALLLAPLPALHAADATKPNIVFIYADDWGWGDLSCHGNTWLKTPRLDKLACEGIDFQQFNVLSPVCSPSRTAALTGRFPGRFGINTVFGVGKPPEMPDWLDPKAPTTPRVLKAAGYRTGHFGKWHLGVGKPTMADYGIDESAVYHGPGPNVRPSGNDIPNQAVKFIEANKDRPFYVNVWLHESHLAHSPSDESMEKWKHLDPRQQVYAAVITDGDNKVGMILDALERCGIAQNTLVVFSSDNGPAKSRENDKGVPGAYRSYYSVGETGGLRGRKTSLFEGGVRVPFIVRWPGHAPAGLKNNATVLTAVDLLPTFCAAAGVTPPTDANGDGDGENVLPALKGESFHRTRPIFWRNNGNKKATDFWPDLAVRDGDWKLVTTFDGQRVELHELKANRAEDAGKDAAKAHPEITVRLSKLVRDWVATLPTKADPACVSKDRGTESENRSQEIESPAFTTQAPVQYRNVALNRSDTNKDAPKPVESTPTGHALPAFSWDQVPQYMHIRKAKKFTDAEIKYLASFPLVAFEKTTGHTAFQTTEDGTLAAAKAVKEVNPSTKILYYRNVIVHYGTYKANAEIQKLPGAFLVGRNGKTKLVRNACEAYDLTNPEVRDWWVGHAKQMCADPAIDGLFLDGNIKVLSPGYLNRDIGKEKKAAQLAGYETMMGEVRKALGPDKIMLANVLRVGQSKDDGLEAIKRFDGSYIEGFELAATQEQKKDNVARGIVAFQKAARDGFIVAFTAGLSELNAEEGDLNPEATDEIRKGLSEKDNHSNRFEYLLALFLTCAEKHSYFLAHDGYGAEKSKVWMKRNPELERPLGAPKGPAVQDGYIYTREFAHAKVRLDIQNEVGEIIWK